VSAEPRSGATDGVPAALFVGSADSTGILEAKRGRLAKLLGAMGRTLVAYSGGVDSSLLLVEAHRVLGADAVGVIARSPSLPQGELDAARDVASRAGIEVRVVDTDELARPDYRANTGDRCFHCKTELFERLSDLAAREDFATLAYGAVTDDLGDVRPGMAAAETFRVRAPLLEAGLSKLEVRVLARYAGLPVWDKPQSACLASRIPVGSEVTEAKLKQVEVAEAWIRSAFGIRVVRVRHGGETARVEVAPETIASFQAPSVLARMAEGLRRAGFSRVVVDPRGYDRPDPLPQFPEEVPDGDRG
jgi:uncharacterized protein